MLGAFSSQASAQPILWQHGFQIAVEDERSIARTEELANDEQGMLHPVAEEHGGFREDPEQRPEFGGDDRGDCGGWRSRRWP